MRNFSCQLSLSRDANGRPSLIYIFLGGSELYKRFRQSVMGQRFEILENCTILQIHV